jgi:RimJ/RimL family protein N-acetyltransferase
MIRCGGAVKWANTVRIGEAFDVIVEEDIPMSIIREIRESDAENFLSLCKQLDHENKFMMLEPGERKTTIDEQKQRITEVLSSANGVIFVAEEAGMLTGYLSAIGGRFARNRHAAYIVIGILERFTGKGLGTAFFEKLEDWAKDHAIHRLELSVMVHNQRGVGLYQKMGFHIEGIKQFGGGICNGEAYPYPEGSGRGRRAGTDSSARASVYRSARTSCP